MMVNLEEEMCTQRVMLNSLLFLKVLDNWPEIFFATLDETVAHL